MIFLLFLARISIQSTEKTTNKDCNTLFKGKMPSMFLFKEILLPKLALVEPEKKDLESLINTRFQIGFNKSDSIVLTINIGVGKKENPAGRSLNTLELSDKFFKMNYDADTRQCGLKFSVKTALSLIGFLLPPTSSAIAEALIRKLALNSTKIMPFVLTETGTMSPAEFVEQLEVEVKATESVTDKLTMGFAIKAKGLVLLESEAPASLEEEMLPESVEVETETGSTPSPSSSSSPSDSSTSSSSREKEERGVWETTILVVAVLMFVVTALVGLFLVVSNCCLPKKSTYNEV